MNKASDRTGLRRLSPLALKYALSSAWLVMLALALGGSGHKAGAQPQQSLPGSYFQGEPLKIGTGVQFLFDDAVVEDRWKLTRTQGRILKYPRNPLVVQDRPWEETVGRSPSVLYDDQMHIYRMWYTCFSPSNVATKKGPSYYIGYAESPDAYVWTKPILQGFPFGGHDGTNIVATGNMKGASGAQVMLNRDQSDRKKRFMIVYTSGSNLSLTYSADGLHWGPEETRLVAHDTGSANPVLWVPETNLWYMFVRSPISPGGMGTLAAGVNYTARRAALTTSPDLRRWSIPRTVFYPGERDLPSYDTAFVFRRNGVFLVLYSAWNHETGSGEVENHLATSRDGMHWEPMWNRQVFVPRGPEGAYDHGEVEPGLSPPIEAGENLLFFYYSAQLPPSKIFNNTGVSMFRMRKDRFVGQTAGEQTGFLLTRQFVLEGSKLLLNFSALPPTYDDQSGGIRAEIIQAPDGKTKATTLETPISGFTMEDADRIVGDAVAQPVTWHGNSDLSALRGKAVYLRFKMKRATLYTFQVAP